ncbi:MAG: metallophosphoesterase [Nitrospirota bacterium]
MSLFLITFFLLYGGMHLYAFLKAKVAFAFGTKISIYFIPFMLLMVVTPFIVRLSERSGLEFVARLMSYIGYTWMGVLLLFVSASFIIDIYRFLVYSSSFIFQRDLSPINPSVRFSFYAPLLLSVIISIYGYFEARNISTERIMLRTYKIPEEIGRLRIVQISDIHLGLIVREERLKRILNEVKAANPDIIVSTGDLVDGQINSLSGLAELLKEINPRYGKFAVTGNHEFYAGLPQALDFTERAGFKVLRGEGITVAGLINIAGIDDPAGQHYGLFKEIPEKELLLSLPREKFNLLLKHRPLLDKNVIGLFDLQLSGHAHKGQFFPFNLFTRLYYPIDAGQLKLLNNSYLYVSRGAGTWGPPIRFLSPPEVTVIDLVHNIHLNISPTKS